MRFNRSFFLTVTMLAVCRLAPGADTQPSATGPMDESRGILEKMAANFKPGQSFSVQAERLWRVTGDGFLMQYTTTFQAASEQPNRFAVVATSGYPAGSFSSDGEQLTIKEPREERFESVPVGQKFDFKDTQDKLAQFSPVSPTTSFLLCLFSDDPVGNMTEGVTEAKVVGREDVDGKAAVHLSFVQEELTWELWVADDAQALPLKMEATLPEQRNDEQIPVKNVNSKWITTFANWKFGEDIPDTLFVLAPSDESEEAPEGTASAEATKNPLIGAAAPELKLALLSGGNFNLADEKGKNVVVLDFWATWCPPCRAGMPVLQKIMGEYKDKGVAVYAVNLREDQELVKKFLEEMKLTLPVLLDSEGSVGQAYGVMAIPQTVIVDKEGIVKAVHVGLTEEAILKKDIDALLAAK